MELRISEPVYDMETPDLEALVMLLIDRANVVTEEVLSGEASPRSLVKWSAAMNVAYLMMAGRDEKMDPESAADINRDFSALMSEKHGDVWREAEDHARRVLLNGGVL